ncbi:MAG: ankyrin repeat domain-containing protein, partial [Puniceicoccales bacterium]|nr:ankyrin repeat domain-containing protein [Puniceicoccales bacterium]
MQTQKNGNGAEFLYEAETTYDGPWPIAQVYETIDSGASTDTLSLLPLLPEAVRSWPERLGMVAKDQLIGSLYITLTVHQSPTDRKNAILWLQNHKGSAAVKILPLSAGQIRFDLSADQNGRLGPRICSLPNGFLRRDLGWSSLDLNSEDAGKKAAAERAAPYWRTTITGAASNTPFVFATLIYWPAGKDDRFLVIGVHVIPPPEFTIDPDTAEGRERLEQLLDQVLPNPISGKTFSAALAEIQWNHPDDPEETGSEEPEGEDADPEETPAVERGSESQEPEEEETPAEEPAAASLDPFSLTAENFDLTEAIANCFRAAEEGEFVYIRKVFQIAAQLDEKSASGDTASGDTASEDAEHENDSSPTQNVQALIEAVYHEKKAEGDDADQETENENSREGQTLLHFAARGGHMRLTRLLLEKGAAVEAKDNDENTPLLLAALNGYTEVVPLLLEKKATVEAKNKYGNTPLILAVSNRHTEIVRLLLEKGAEVEAKTNDGDPPLILAGSKGHTEIVRLLLEK